MAVQEMLQSITDKMSSAATVNTVFGPPTVMNNRAVIPVAMVIGGFGAGGGEGRMPSNDGTAQEGTGGGGGGGFVVRPLAFLEVTETETRLIPVLDLTRVILAGVGLLGGALWMLSRACNNGRRGRHY